MKESERYFFAIDIPEAAVPPLTLVQDHLPREGIRYSFVHYFHMTLKFLGELDEVKVMQAQLRAKEIASRMKFSPDDLKISFKGVGVFWKGGDPTVVWAGVKISDALFDFQRNLEEGLESAGFHMEKKPFKPHITLVRVRDVDRSALDQATEKLNHLGVKKKTFSIEGFNLMKSHLVPGKPARYDEIKHFLFDNF